MRMAAVQALMESGHRETTDRRSIPVRSVLVSQRQPTMVYQRPAERTGLRLHNQPDLFKLRN